MPKPHLSSFIIHPSLLIILSLFIIHFALFISGCTSSTKPRIGSLSGIVTLVNDTGDTSLDPVDFSGVTVALYRLAVLDTTIVRINQEYPQIGVQINQETEFDHRKNNPVSVAITDAIGAFRFDKISVGFYNIVLMKEGWGYRYIYSVSVMEGDNSLTRDPSGLINSSGKETIQLYPERFMPSVTNDSFTFLAGRHYIFEQDTFMIGPVTLQTGTVLRVSPDLDLKFASEISVLETAGAARFSITSNAFSYSVTAVDSVYCYDMIALLSPLDYSIIHGQISNSQNGIQSVGGSILYQDMVFRDGGTSIVGGQAEIEFKNSVVTRFDQISQNYYSTTLVHHNIYYNNSGKCMVLFDNDALITNNYFIGNFIGLQTFRGNTQVRNNCFDRNYVGIAPCTSNPQIIQNEFYDDFYNLELSAYLAQTGNITYCDPIVSDNNFYYTHKIFNLIGQNGLYLFIYGTPNGVNGPLNCANNYWKAADPTQLIYPATYSNLIYLPRRVYPLQSAGIQ